MLHSVLYIAIRLVFLWCLFTLITLLLKTFLQLFITYRWKSRLLNLAFTYVVGGKPQWASRIPAHPYRVCQLQSLTIFWPRAISVASNMAPKSVMATAAWLPWACLLPGGRRPVSLLLTIKRAEPWVLVSCVAPQSPGFIHCIIPLGQSDFGTGGFGTAEPAQPCRHSCCLLCNE